VATACVACAGVLVELVLVGRVGGGEAGVCSVLKGGNCPCCVVWGAGVLEVLVGEVRR